MRKLFTILSTLGLLLGVVGITAPAASAACASARIVWYEGANYSGQSHTFGPGDCTHSKSFDMTEYRTADDHNCQREDPFVWPPQILNDCASSWKVLATCHMHYTLYKDTAPPAVVMDSGSAPKNRATMPLGWDDALSYIKFTYTPTCISGPV